ncbi:unnamed protein product [Coccothraustes coccothraustes]
MSEEGKAPGRAARPAEGVGKDAAPPRRGERSLIVRNSPNARCRAGRATPTAPVAIRPFPRGRRCYWLPLLPVAVASSPAGSRGAGAPLMAGAAAPLGPRGVRARRGPGLSPGLSPGTRAPGSGLAGKLCSGVVWPSHSSVVSVPVLMVEEAFAVHSPQMAAERNAKILGDFSVEQQGLGFDRFPQCCSYSDTKPE